MQVITGVFIGMFIFFLFFQYAEKQSKKAGDKCGYDCAKCDTHCVGYHCYLERQNVTETSVGASSDN